MKLMPLETTKRDLWYTVMHCHSQRPSGIDEILSEISSAPTAHTEHQEHMLFPHTALQNESLLCLVQRVRGMWFSVYRSAIGRVHLQNTQARKSRRAHDCGKKSGVGKIVKLNFIWSENNVYYGSEELHLLQSPLILL